MLIAGVGFGMSERSTRAISPPIYDAMSYFEKGTSTWKTLRAGKILEILNIDPDIRPPGTTLMSFPLGFDPDFHGFLFRSVFSVLLWVLALGIVHPAGRKVPFCALVGDGMGDRAGVTAHVLSFRITDGIFLLGCMGLSGYFSRRAFRAGHGAFAYRRAKA
jgi:hypothetical protein